MGQIKNSQEKLHQPIYDRYVLDYSPGGPGCPRSISQGMRFFCDNNCGDPQRSNVETPGHFPSNHTYAIKQVEVILHISDELLLAQVLRGGYVEIVVHCKQYFEMPLSRATSEASQRATIVERPDPPVLIPPGSNYYARLQLPDNVVNRIRKYEHHRLADHYVMIELRLTGERSRDIL